MSSAAVLAQKRQSQGPSDYDQQDEAQMSPRTRLTIESIKNVSARSPKVTVAVQRRKQRQFIGAVSPEQLQ